MELLLISKNKIKISLTCAELSDYRISFSDMDYGNTETRRFFWTLFDDVKAKTGFDAASGRIFIQIYPGNDGDCEIYVSRLNGADSGREPTVNVFYGLGDRGETGVHTEFYRFDDVSGLISVCRRLNAVGYSGRASAYSGDLGDFYLSLAGGDGTGPFIGEYGERCGSGGTELYIKEHCRRICDGDAVLRLCEL